MNDDIKSWQNLWQSTHFDLKNSEEMIQQLNKIEAKNKKSRLFLLYAFPTTILFLVGMAFWVGSYYTFVGAILIGCGMAMIIGQMYKNQYEETAPGKTVSNLSFYQERLTKLKGTIKITNFYMWIYFGLVALGINIAHFDVLQPLDIKIRLAIHFGETLIMFVICYFGIKQKMNEYQKELIPLVKQLEDINRG